MNHIYNETRTDMPVYNESTRTREDNDINFVTTQSDEVKTDIEQDEPCGELTDNSFNVSNKEDKLQPLKPNKIAFKHLASISHKNESSPIFNTDNLNVVEHPNHYGAGNGGLQCIEAMLQTFGKAATMDFCKLNAFKYIWRSDHKDKEIQDMEKAKRYLEYWHVLVKLKGDSDDGSFHDYLNN